MWEFFQIVSQLAFLLFSPVFVWFLLSPYLVERIRRRRGDGAPILSTVREGGWHPVDVLAYDTLVSQSVPRRWSLRDQLKADAPTSWWVHGWTVAGIGSAITGWNLGLLAVPFATMMVGGTLVLVGVRRHGAIASLTVDSIRGPLFMSYGSAPLNLAKATLGARGDVMNRVLLPWRPCRLLLDRHGVVEVMVFLDRRGKPVNVLAMRAPPAA